jgi:LysR family nitrogen assimilation transcriptional regulator
MAKIVADFADKYPNAKLSLRESVSPSVREWLLEGKVDCAVYCQSGRRPGIIEIPLLEEEICFLCSPKFIKPFPVIELADLAQMPLIMPSGINASRQCLDEALMSQGLTPKITIEIDGLGAIRRLLRDGRGGTVMPHSACRNELASGELFAARINDPRMTRTLVFAHMADRPMSRVSAELFKLVETEVATLVRQGEWAGTIP